jgi:hypothetical protein
MDSSQCPLSNYLSPICGSKSHEFIRSIRSDVEPTSKRESCHPEYVPLHLLKRLIATMVSEKKMITLASLLSKVHD